MVLKKSRQKNAIQLILLCLIFCSSAIRMYNSYVIQMEIINVVIKYMLIILSILFIFQSNTKLIPPFIFGSVITSVLFFNYLFWPDNRPYIQGILEEQWIYIFVLILCVYYVQYRTIENALIISAGIILVIDTLLILSPNYYRLFVNYGYGGVGATYSYSLLFPAIVYLYLFKNKKQKIFLFLSGSAAFLMIFYGSARTAALCYIIYFVFQELTSENGFNSKKIIRMIIFIIGFVFVFFNLSSILQFIGKIIGKDGYNSRIIDLFGSGALSTDSGRFELQRQLLPKIFSVEGCLGYGICGDRVITSTHEYSHNIFLQLLVEFGLVGGGLVILLMLYLFYNAIIKKTRFNKILGILFPVGILPYFVTGTFWRSYYFWMFVTICFRILSGNVSCDDKNINKISDRGKSTI